MDLKEAQTKNYYQLLGVAPDATTERIKEVYKDLARVYHPDSNFYDEIVPQKASSDQVQVFKIITAAYNTLIDPNKRAEYDLILNPLKSLGLKAWEDKDDFWNKNQKLEEDFKTNPPDPKTTGRARQMTGTFGRAEFMRAGWDQKNPQDQEFNRQIQPVSEIILRKSGSIKTYTLLGVGIGLGIVGLLALAYFIIR